jgi:hypothetical protein
MPGVVITVPPTAKLPCSWIRSSPVWLFTETVEQADNNKLVEIRKEMNSLLSMIFMEHLFDSHRFMVVQTFN